MLQKICECKGWRWVICLGLFALAVTLLILLAKWIPAQWFDSVIYGIADFLNIPY